MNNRQLYLAWLRTYAPTVYANSIRKATGQTKSLGGLTDDLMGKALSPDLRHSFLGDDTDLEEIPVTASYTTDPVTFDASSVDIETPVVDTSSISVPASVAIAPAAAAPASSSNIFTNVLAAVGSVAVGALNATNQSKLIALNTQRAAQGLPPVNANGQVVTAAGTAVTSPGLLAFEKAISGGSGSMLIPILLLLGVGYVFLSRPRSA